MSKLSFRARALDPTKPMPIYLAEELPDLPEYSAINRAVPQMPSGMEKEEESEHHLQRAICTGLIIPTPEVLETDHHFYDRNYPADYKMTRQMIHMQPLGLEQDIPDYDMDTADETWVTSQTRRLDLNPLKFEQMMDRLEKSSGQTVVTLNEAKALLKQDDEVSIAVYDYWLNKRLKTQHPLLLSVRTENRAGTAANNPYLAFRRRTEKMQTRKNRKNDEQSYEKMLKLRRDLSRAVTLLELIKRREKTKREQLHLSIEIFEKRYQTKDFSGHLLNEYTSNAIKTARPAFAPIYANQYSSASSAAAQAAAAGQQWSTSSSSGNHQYAAANAAAAAQYHSVTNAAAGSGSAINATAASAAAVNKRGGGDISAIGGADAGGGNNSSRKEKRQYKKRKHKTQQRDKPYPSTGPATDSMLHLASSDEDESLAASMGVGGSVTAASATAGSIGAANLAAASSSAAGASAIAGGNVAAGPNHLGHESVEEEGLYHFRRSKISQYHKPLTQEPGNWPWTSRAECGAADPKYRFNLTSLRYQRPRCIGFARRRVGRGGRIVLDRVATNMDELWSSLDFTIFDSETSRLQQQQQHEHFQLHNRHRSQQQQQQPEEESIVGDLIVPVKSEPIDSVVVDLLRPTTMNTTMLNRRKSSIESVTAAAAARTKTLSWNNSGGVENIVINSEQNNVVLNIKQEQLDDFNNCSSSGSVTTTTPRRTLPPPPPNFNMFGSGVGTPTTSSSSSNALIRRTLSQSINSISYNNSNVNNNNKNNLISGSSSGSGSGGGSSFVSGTVNNRFQPNHRQSVPPHLDRSTSLPSFQQQQQSSIKLETYDVNGGSGGGGNLRKTISDLECGGDSNKALLLSSSSSTKQDEDLYSEFLSEIRRDWLHFRPKTPTRSVADDEDGVGDNSEPLPFDHFGDETASFTERTALQIEIQRLTAQPPSSMLNEHHHGVDYDDDMSSSSLFVSNAPNLFLTQPFTLDDITVVQPPLVTPPEMASPPLHHNHHDSLSSSTSTVAGSGNDINLSGDSLPELSLSLGENEENEKMLENILQECCDLDLKTFNTTTNFWNGILEDAGQLCEDIDDSATPITPTTKKVHTEFSVGGAAAAAGGGDRRTTKRRKGGSSASAQQRIGCSAFSISNIPKDDFFKKEDPVNDESLATSEGTVKCSDEPVTKVNANSGSMAAAATAPAAMMTTATTSTTTTNIKIEPPDDILETVKLVRPIQVQATATPSLSIVKTEVIQMGGGGGGGGGGVGTTSTVAYAPAATSAVQHQSNAIIIQQQQQSQMMQQHPQKTYVIQQQQPQQQQQQQQHVQHSLQQHHQTIQLQHHPGGGGGGGEGTLILSSAASPLRRQPNGPNDKTPIQHLLTRASLVNKKFQIQQRPANNDSTNTSSSIAITTANANSTPKTANINNTTTISNIDDFIDIKPTLVDIGHLNNSSISSAIGGTNTTYIKMSPYAVASSDNTTTTTNTTNVQNAPNSAAAAAAAATKIIMNASAAVAANHNYSLAPHHQQQQQQQQLQQQHHNQQQPIIIGQTSSGVHNKFIINSASVPAGSNITIAPMQQQQQQHLQQQLSHHQQHHQDGSSIKSNLKLNLVSTQAMQQQQQQQQQPQQQLVVVSGGGDNGGGVSGDATTTILTTSGNVIQHHQLQQQQHHQQHQLKQNVQQQNRKTVNMVFDADKNRILYTNIKTNNRGQPILASFNQKMVNLLPMQQQQQQQHQQQQQQQQKNAATAGATVQSIVHQQQQQQQQQQQNVGVMKQQNVQRIATIGQAQIIRQQQQQQSNIATHQQLLSAGISVVGGGGSGGGGGPSNQTGAGQSGQQQQQLQQGIITTDSLKLNDGTTTTVSGININTTNR